ncbi:hypothetical protein UE46_p05410 [Listeria phage LWP01]|uniref:Uncharacterized protein n=1 Tax=Listeria weihenstephanensis TaxID=1006155 RepID=A0A3B6XGW7_9LIST|nr:hypothetical protein UE46_05410 [Listeria phage LWP01] [Listeria weihenstephanensis]AQY52667.1 hypothetical protein UE46_p05410 [Listeria phage LWP01]
MDIQEKEYFMMTIKDALRRDWVCRVKVFEQYRHGLYSLAPFEDARYFAEMGEEAWRILSPTQIRIATQEIEFKDVNGVSQVIEFRDILDIEIG